jgi:hypothetical protein
MKASVKFYINTLTLYMEKFKWLYFLDLSNNATHSLMELSPSWEAANCAATQEILIILWNPKNRMHKYNIKNV